MQSTKIKDIIELFRQELTSVYSEKETESILFLVLHHVIGFSRTESVLRKEELLEEITRKKLFTILGKLKRGMPVQYVLGHTEFYGLDFLVRPGVLIPRPETEELCNWIIKENKNRKAVMLDIGTGSGCIAITLKKHIEDCTVYACDISEKALEIAGKNATKNNAGIHFFKSDTLNSKEKKKLPQFDVIVSNPPYIRNSEKKLMKPNVLNYEPHEALFVSDKNPLLFYKAIAGFSLNHLCPGGYLYFEINENLSSELVEVIDNMGFHDIQIKKDVNGKYRMLKCIPSR